VGGDLIETGCKRREFGGEGVQRRSVHNVLKPGELFSKEKTTTSGLCEEASTGSRGARRVQEKRKRLDELLPTSYRPDPVPEEKERTARKQREKGITNRRGVGEGGMGKKGGRRSEGSGQQHQGCGVFRRTGKPVAPGGQEY